MLIAMNETTWTVKQAAVIYGKSEQTIRNWCTEFAEHLTRSANPGRDKDRLLSADDMAVIDYIARSKALGQEFGDIHAGLASGQRGMAPQVPMETLNALVASQQDLVLQGQVEYQNQVIKLLNDQIQELTDQVAKLPIIHDENIRLQTDKEHLEKRIVELENRLEIEYQRGLAQGKAEGELEALRQSLKKKKR